MYVHALHWTDETKNDVYGLWMLAGWPMSKWENQTVHHRIGPTWRKVTLIFGILCRRYINGLAFEFIRVGLYIITSLQGQDAALGSLVLEHVVLENKEHYYSARIRLLHPSHEVPSLLY